MIERFYLKNFLSFSEVSLEFERGLVVFSGPSGSGKSIFFASLLSSLGFSSCDAEVAQSSVAWEVEEYDDEDLLIFKHTKKDKSRYFINNQNISKKSMQDISSRFVRHLSLRDFSDFEQVNLLDLLDLGVAKKDKTIVDLKSTLASSYAEFIEAKKELDRIDDEQKRVVELIEFARFEIEKISSVDPKIGEDEELLEIKKELSKKEKVLEAISQAMMIFESEHSVYAALDLLDEDSSALSDTLNNLRATLESAIERAKSLDDVDVESVLNRIEALSELKRRYGSIKEALEHKKLKVDELKRFENIEHSRDELAKRVDLLSSKIDELSHKLSTLRSGYIGEFMAQLNGYLRELYLRDAKVELLSCEVSAQGRDEVSITLGESPLKQLSTGEFNRLRLALLAVRAKHLRCDGGVLILDEIDANLSGEESMSVARVLKELSNSYQIFAISHQSQLTSMASQHFLVHKDGSASHIKELDHSGRIEEIARIISGDKITKEALEFAKEILK